MLENKIKSLINIIEDTEINELEVSSFWGAQKIRLQKNMNFETETIKEVSLEDEEKSVSFVRTPKTEPVIPIVDLNATQEPEVGSALTETVEIIAPLVGTFYRSAKAGAPAFVNEGDTIKVGQTICIIEAMKIFNEIEAEVSGKIVKIVVNDSSPVEYGQVLMIIKPS